MIQKSFGIIGEGITDLIVIEQILIGWAENKNLDVRHLQPKEGETGNWDKVLKYCQSSEFKSALSYVDYVVIQIDTDIFGTENVSKLYSINYQSLSIAQIVDAVKGILVGMIGTNFYEQFNTRIIFAIAVNEIECWFLPIYYADKKASKSVECIKTLNAELSKKEGFYISKKEIGYYRKISKHFKKKKEILEYSQKNSSFQLFINELDIKIR